MLHRIAPGVALAALILLFGTTAQSDAPEAKAASFEVRITRLEKRGFRQPGVQRPLQAAKLARRRARAAEAAGDPRTAARTLALARAALRLAEARADYLQEHKLTTDAQARLDREREHAKAAKKALEALRAQRADKKGAP